MKNQEIERKARQKKKQKIIIAFSFAVYLILLFYFLFFAEILGRTYVGRTYHYNLVPFKEIMRFWNYRSSLGMMAVIMNLLGNVVIFVPFGMLMPVLNRRCRTIWYTVYLSFELSLLVEAIQLVSKVGSFDVDDLMLNTLGGMLGYILYRIVQYSRRKYYGKKKL